MNADGACTIYERRPGACRAYDCRNDRRVWLDFEARVPAPR
jgi:Fe-S-cluster containining protein